MPSVKFTGVRYQLTVKCKSVRDKPWYFTFDDPDEAMDYGIKLEALLKAGIVPPEIIDESKKIETITHVIREYLVHSSISEGDKSNLNVLIGRIGNTKLSTVDNKWVDGWLTGMKRENNIAPPTIRQYVGALARCFDWGVRQGIPMLVINPLRTLPKGYSSYTQADLAFFEGSDEDDGLRVKSTVERDRRLEPGEEDRIRAILNREKPEGRERAFFLNHQAAIECMFDIAIDSAMRMREIYRLKIDVIDLQNQTAFIKKAKSLDPMNPRTRQVPLSSDVVKSITKYMQRVADQTHGMKGFNYEGGCLFPWWDGVRWGKNSAENKYLRDITTRLSQQYARIFDAAGCPDLNFHDTRHEGTSRLFERTQLSDFEIMKITGHSSIKLLARYANLRASKLAHKLW